MKLEIKKIVSVATLFVLSLGIVPLASAQVINATIWLDTYENASDNLAGPVYTSDVLQGLYSVTVRGTFSFWSASGWQNDGCGSPEVSPIYQSPATANGRVGADVDTAFAAIPGHYTCGLLPAHLVSGLYSYAGTQVEFSLDGGSNWAHMEPVGPGDETHEYVYSLTGTGSPFGIRLRDSNTTDNYGKLSVEANRCGQQVTGGGKINRPDAKKPEWTFAGTVGYCKDSAPLAGQFQMVDHVGGISCHFDTFSNLAFSGSATASPPSLYNVATFKASGLCNDGSTPNVTVQIVDNAEPGAGVDQVSVSGDIEIALGAIDGGNFQVYVQP